METRMHGESESRDMERWSIAQSVSRERRTEANGHESRKRKIERKKDKQGAQNG